MASEWAVQNTTYEQLLRHWDRPCLSLAQFREFYLPHIKTDRYLLHQIKAGNIQIRLTRLHGSIRATPVIFLHDLAQYLDALAPSAPPSRDN
ncbi:pyocin activator PrtN family protein [Pseudomonas lundensis]|jgi:hypothetical protein|uniref:pyocin activator PrtN family protein n=1 Tax=Pseudomonas lundensis TaxID=86185 RepID=UPI000BE2B6BC|nr:pyocin activator PrtN family protein [Pseudomonas lundensis]